MRESCRLFRFKRAMAILLGAFVFLMCILITSMGTVYAESNYTVTYHANHEDAYFYTNYYERKVPTTEEVYPGGTVIQNGDCEAKYNSYISHPDVEDMHLILKGYSTDPHAKNPDGEIVVNQDMDLYAVWEKGYIVTFHANHKDAYYPYKDYDDNGYDYIAEGSEKQEVFTKGTDFIKSTMGWPDYHEVKNSSLRFLGYSTNPKAKQADNSIIANKDMDVYAVWDEIPKEKDAEGESADDEVKGRSKDGKFSALALRSMKQGSKNIQLAWNKVKGAKTYVVYGNACGKKNKMKKLATVRTNKYNVRKISKKLKKGTYHKFIVVALNSKNNVVSSSKVIHVATKGGKVGNHKSVSITAKVDKNGKAIKSYKALSQTKLKRGKTIVLKSTATPYSKKLKVANHRKISYESSNTKIATVNAKGKVTAKKKGSCYIYAYAQNGVFKRIKVTVN